AEIVRSKFRTRLVNEDIRQLTLNFNIWGSDIISAIPQTFDVVGTSDNGIRRIDVNIVDDANTTNRILALLKGSITVHQWTDGQIHFTFEGEAGGILTQQNTIPVSGSVNMKCSKR